MTAEPTETVIQAWLNLVRAQHRVLGAVEADLKSAGFPPLAWYDVLLELRRAEPDQLRPMEIEQNLLLAQHNVSRLIDRLEAAGHVHRQPCENDARGHWVILTEQGRQLLIDMWPSYRTAIQRHVGCRLTNEEAATLARLLGRLRPTEY